MNLDFSGVSMAATNATISITNASFEVTGPNGISIIGAFTFNGIGIMPGEISLFAMPGTPCDGTMILGLGAFAGGDPVLELSGFNGQVTVLWDTSGGGSTESISPGTPLTLTGCTG